MFFTVVGAILFVLIGIPAIIFGMICLWGKLIEINEHNEAKKKLNVPQSP